MVTLYEIMLEKYRNKFKELGIEYKDTDELSDFMGNREYYEKIKENGWSNIGMIAFFSTMEFELNKKYDL